LRIAEYFFVNLAFRRNRGGIVAPFFLSVNSLLPTKNKKLQEADKGYKIVCLEILDIYFMFGYHLQINYFLVIFKKNTSWL